MTTAIILYILLLIVFLIISSLILRHAIKFNYLSTRFTYMVGVFGVIAFIVIVLSIVLLLNMDNSGSAGYYESPPASNPTTRPGTGDLNF